MTKTTTPPQLLTIGDCCASGQFGRSLFYRLAREDPEFPPLIKIGTLTRIDRDAWCEYLAARGGASVEPADPVIDEADDAAA